MKKNVVIGIMAFLIIVNLALNILGIKTDKNLVYVRSHDLVYAYTGMKEMQLKFQDQIKVWESNIDTLKMEYQHSLNEYQRVVNQLSKEERITRENLLRVQQSNILKYSENVQLKSKEQEEEMLESVLNQVNSFVEEYGKENNYDIILGTTRSGSILYGKETIDITEELIIALNKHYSGEQ